MTDRESIAKELEEKCTYFHDNAGNGYTTTSFLAGADYILEREKKLIGLYTESFNNAEDAIAYLREGGDAIKQAKHDVAVEIKAINFAETKALYCPECNMYYPHKVSFDIYCPVVRVCRDPLPLWGGRP